MQRFRKKPVVIEAIRFDVIDGRNNGAYCAHWCGGRYESTAKPSDPDDVSHTIVIPTLEGLMTANNGDWIIKGVQGEFYPCKPDIFEATYESV
jgi:hypothetical protein